MPANSSAVRLASIIVPSGVISPGELEGAVKDSAKFFPALPECFFGTFLIRNIPDTSHAGRTSLVLDKAYIEGDKNPGCPVAFQQSALIVFRYGLTTMPAVAPFEDHITVFRRDESLRNRA